MASVTLPEVDRVEVLTVLDLSLDLLMAGGDTVRRVDVTGTLGEGRSTLRAEHGFSNLVTVVQGDRKGFVPLRHRAHEGEERGASLLSGCGHAGIVLAGFPGVLPDPSGMRKIAWPEPPLVAAAEDAKRGGVRKGESMTRRSVAVEIVLAWAFALTLEGCAGSATVTSALLCENAGGKYVNRTCTPGSSRRAEDMCAGFGGIYSAREDECTIPSKTP